MIARENAPMDSPPPESREDLFDVANDPSNILVSAIIAAMDDATKNDLRSSEQVYEMAGSPALARAATEKGCELLAQYLAYLAGEVGQGGLPPRLGLIVAAAISLHADSLHDIGRGREALRLYDAILPLIDKLEIVGQHVPADWPSSVMATCRDLRAHILESQAIVRLKLGQSAEALASFDALYRQHDLAADLATGVGANLSVTLAELGRYAEAVASYDAALRLFRQHGRLADLASTLMNRATTLAKLGKCGEAVADCRAALNLFRQHGQPADVALCQMNLATILSKQGKHAEAAASYDAALNLFRQHGLPAYVARCLESMTAALHNQGRYAEAVAGYDAALPLLRQHGLPADVARCQLNRANALEGQGRYDEALTALYQVDASLLGWDLRRSYHQALGYALWSLGNRQNAHEHYTRARQLLRLARRVGGIDETSLEYVRKRSVLVEVAVQCALELDRPEDAFSAVQDGKGVLGDLRQRLGDHPAAEPPEVLAARNRLVEWLRRPPPGLTTDDYLAERRQRTHAYLSAWGQFHHAYRADAPDQTAADEPISLRTIQEALPGGWALLDFWRTAYEEITAFVVTHNEFHVERLPFPVRKRPSFAGRLDRLLRWINDPLYAPPDDEALNDLGASLFLPLRQRLRDRGICGLYLVPHGVLHAFPLHAARYPGDTGRDVFLCDEFAVAYLPSASLLPQLPPVRLGGPVLSLANPQHGTRKTLPFADWEGRQLRRRFGGGAGRFRLGKEATFAEADRWHDAGLAHFSCHGFADTSFGPLSHLCLADDLLLAHDVMYRRPPLPDGSLAILNGCQTAVRDWTAVDEGMGLMSAFLLRGASLVLATQWSVIDCCAAEMVLTFVDQMRQGALPADALRQAQAAARKMDAATILARCEEVRREYPDDSHEAANIRAQEAWVSEQAGMETLAKEHAAAAERLLRRLHRETETDRLAALLRGEGCKSKLRRLHSFDHPIFWGAFHLVGRVT
jgi:CHAT domain-containing protein